MDNRNLIIHQFNALYQILNEIASDINFKITQSSDKDLLISELDKKNYYLIITKKKIPNIKKNEIILNQLPIKIPKLIEILNIEFLKQKFNEQSEFSINNYKINLNSREIMLKDIKLKLTEKEVNIIVYLSKMNKSVSIDELQINVWGYKSELETHTVETHIYRLRKKIIKIFEDNKFIISKKNGYQITKKK